NLENSFTKLGLSTDEVNSKMEAVKTEYATLQNMMSNGASGNEIVNQFKKVNSELKKSQNEVVQLKTQLDQIYNPNKQLRLSNNIQEWLQKNTKATRDAKEQLEKYYQELNSGEISVNRLNQIRDEFEKIKITQRGLGKLGKNLKDQMAQAVTSFSQWISISSAVMLGVNKFKDAISELKELDDILTEISKTSNLTSSQLKELGNSAFDSASKYGKSASDYLTGVQEMYRAGFDNASEMSQLSILAQSAGDMTAEMSNDYLIATSAAYDLKGNVKDLNDVLDGQNYITNNAAVSMSDMASATSEAASIASQYGVKINELSSLIAVATAKTRESGSETGNALKSLFINLQDTTSKPIREAFEAVGISMTKMVNGAEKLKTPIELLKELSKAFNELPEGDTRRANILSDIGGKFYHVMQKCITRMNLIAGNALEPCTTI
ncbi:MAG: phage tail tape measure protein, partial [Lachnospiraceae bacterium]|nr:phage tail tape measure protein [Lachnospiraceae bacterium]